ncbi:metal/formaldehyde-sensitive transcriptional repressor [Brenneria populi subsp. brevivirga]|uniref:Metal/formaldehyde-sensitive transcriptional repressor n=1 Tax=Brenneria populi TaxID=1505588 RepID=A0ABU6JQ02_9GAMM|nr:metal/formaldehyde-sensitive transcriptional repressor [Brenneria populi subsp. brevivirga]MEC5342819.1 metal/formaldehyde-sensitive transcriptional repressor [Brenneria populi Li et al. 2015]
MSHTIKGKKKLLARIRKIKGQTEAIEKLLENETPCLNILQQIAAVRGAVNGLMVEVLEGHIREHLMDESHSPQERSGDLEEIVSVVRSYLK